jgi:hypothetical protein
VETFRGGVTYTTDRLDSFEQLVAAVLDRAGYWVRMSVKVNLTPEDKRAIGRPSSPRWEIDVVAYNGRDQELLGVVSRFGGRARRLF